MATTCLFLASKVEETPKKLRDVIVETYKVQHNTASAPESDAELWRMKEQVLICERELLRVLEFDLSVDHAYRHATAGHSAPSLGARSCWRSCRPVGWPPPLSCSAATGCAVHRPLLAYVKSISGPRDLAQIAWNFINDSLRTTVCLQFAPRCLAAAAVYMASSYLQMKQRPITLPDHRDARGVGKWYAAFNVRETTVRAIVEQIQQMYDDNKGGGAVLLSNSGAVEKMRVQGVMAGGAKIDGGGIIAKSEGGSSDAKTGQGSAGSAGANGGVKRDTSSNSSACVKRDSHSIKRDSHSVKREARDAREEGELEEGELEQPAGKRSKADP